MATEEKKKGEFQITIKNCRLSFEHVFRAQPPKKNADGTPGTSPPKFNCVGLIPKSDIAQIAMIKDTMTRARDKKWPPVKGQPKKLKSEKLCLRNGDDEEYDGYAGHLYIAASNTRAPKIVNRNRQPVTEESGIIYSGCYVNLIVNIWCQDNEHGQRINASLDGVQFVRDGEAFGSGQVTEDDFEDLGGALDDSGLGDDDAKPDDDGFL